MRIIKTIYHHHIALVARISLTLSCHSSLSFIALGRSSGQHPVSSHSCWMYVRAGHPAFARPCVWGGVHKSTSLWLSNMNSWNHISKVKLATVDEGNPKAPFSIATTSRWREGATSFPWLLHFALNTYLILLSVKQGGIKYHF